MKNTFKLAGSEVMQIASRNAVVDSRGLYASTITRKYVVSPGSVETAEKYVVEQQFGSTTSENVWKGVTTFAQSEVSDWLWDNYDYFIDLFDKNVNKYN